MTKKVFLTMSDKLYKTLGEKTRKNGYITIQELINETLRREFMPQQKSESKTNRRGRPEKKTFEDYFSVPTKETRKLEREGLI